MTTQLQAVFNQRSYKTAVAYSNNNDVQVSYGKKFIEIAGVQSGDKILDMGCGTGELTSFLAEIVGRDGKVVGVDPDIGRIQYAKQKHLSLHENLVFENGDSSTEFHQRNKSYYDVHFSNFVFQWLSPERKEEYARVAFESLKYGGIIALQSHEVDPQLITKANEMIFCTPNLVLKKEHEENEKAIPFFIKKFEVEGLLKKCGFEILLSDYHIVNYQHKSILDFLNYHVASDYHDGKIISTIGLKDFSEIFVNNDGSVDYIDPTAYQILAQKI
ncbi:carboxy-S-adenosyl-L-methionine synthase-like [Xenia sp. Carnegie-2017]|uniref:carboxy-S-adenosyl-L-methionine synthase-like n=1 Tax=Xenia sp. Carnegie-2017 TaxID=2897299 RepID=UPI001F0480CF|nr:carboxy-S-adenosyl-L-methionine synthase-like [Xenia sp. Carnegie-2017]